MPLGVPFMENTTQSHKGRWFAQLTNHGDDVALATRPVLYRAGDRL